MVSDSSTSNEVLLDGMWNGETLEHWNCMGDTITGVANHTGGSTIGVKRKDSLNSNIKTLNLECLEHKLGHLLSVSLRVAWGRGEEDFVLGWVYSELVGEAILPDLLHVVPVGNNTGLDW